MVTWIPSIYPSDVSIYTSTMDPSWDMSTLISTTSPMNLAPLALLNVSVVSATSSYEREAKLGKAHPNNYAKHNFKYKYIIGHIIPEQALNLINLPSFFDPAGS